MLIGGGQVLQLMRLFKLVTFSGRPGSGKTSLAFRMAHDLVKSGYFRYIITNIGSSWTDKPENVVLRSGMWADAVFILDEAGVFLPTGSKLDTFIAYMRKVNIVVLCPSFVPPSRSLKVIDIQRTINFQSIGLPLWQYRGSVYQGRIREDFGFWWFNPGEIYGIYDTDAMPSDDGGLEDWLIRWTDESAKARGYKEISKAQDKSSTLGTGVEAFPNYGLDVAGVARSLDETAQVIEQALPIFESASRGKKGRKRGR